VTWVFIYAAESSVPKCTSREEEESVFKRLVIFIISTCHLEDFSVFEFDRKFRLKRQEDIMAKTAIGMCTAQYEQCRLYAALLRGAMCDQ
jgi:hypothetical protein